MAKTGGRRQRGTIRKRGNSFQVSVYAGVDPLTGRRHYLTDSARDAREAERLRKQLAAQVDSESNARTRATLETALEAWLRTHEAEECRPAVVAVVRRVVGADPRGFVVRV